MEKTPEKTTGDLRNELLSQPHLDEYVKENRDQFVNWGLTEQLMRLFDEKNVSKAAVARNGGMSEVYLYQVLSGRRNPSRDRLLCICFGLGTTEEETQRLLKSVGYAPLYPRLKRDAVILHGIVHGTPLAAVNDRLFEENEGTLY